MLLDHGQEVVKESGREFLKGRGLLLFGQENGDLGKSAEKFGVGVHDAVHNAASLPVSRVVVAELDSEGAQDGHALLECLALVCDDGQTTCLAGGFAGIPSLHGHGDVLPLGLLVGEELDDGVNAGVAIREVLDLNGLARGGI